MHPIVAAKKRELADACRRFRVARLEVFGSAATEGFDEASSDIDFLVEFIPGQDLGPWMSLYFDFRSELEKLLGRPVDLVMPTAMKNPHFIREVNRTRRLLYAA
jgi:predicted nucleotidyltransferase